MADTSSGNWVISYKPNFAPENGDLSLENTYFWDDIV
jgi:hypothetical protein